MRVPIGIAAGLFLTATLGCRGSAGFACSSDEQCTNLAGESGRCFPVGACGYIDGECASGYRYSEDAPEPWTQQCVVPQDPPATTSVVGSSSGGPVEGSSSTAEGSSSTGGGSQPLCGNAVVDDGELCDDGDDVEGNGCNPDCRPSGTLIRTFASELAGHDEARSVMLVEGGDVVVAGIAGDPDITGFVARYQADGVELWRFAENVDAVSAVQPAESGNVRALGQVLIAGAKKGAMSHQDYWLAELDVSTGAPNWVFVRGELAPGSERGNGLAILPDGDMIVAGRVGEETNSDFGVTRFSVVPDKKGAFELATIWAQAFDGGIGARDFANAVAWDSAGRIVLGGGLELVAGDIDRHLRALDTDGASGRPPCEDFGGDDPLSADDRINAVAVGPGGEIVAAGRATRQTGQGPDAWLGYYLPGTCELAWVETEPGAGQQVDAFTAVAIDELGNIVAGGYLNTGNNDDAWLVKYDPAGQRLWAIDPIDGTGNGADRVAGIAIDTNREITVAGRLTRPGDTDLWVARYTP